MRAIGARRVREAYQATYAPEPGAPDNRAFAATAAAVSHATYFAQRAPVTTEIGLVAYATQTRINK